MAPGALQTAQFDEDAVTVVVLVVVEVVDVEGVPILSITAVSGVGGGCVGVGGFAGCGVGGALVGPAAATAVTAGAGTSTDVGVEEGVHVTTADTTTVGGVVVATVVVLGAVVVMEEDDVDTGAIVDGLVDTGVEAGDGIDTGEGALGGDDSCTELKAVIVMVVSVVAAVVNNGISMSVAVGGGEVGGMGMEEGLSIDAIVSGIEDEVVTARGADEAGGGEGGRGGVLANSTLIAA